MIHDEKQNINNTYLLLIYTLIDSKYRSSRNFNKFVDYHKLQNIEYYIIYKIQFLTAIDKQYLVTNGGS